MPDTAYLIALLQARADDDADSVAELVDILRGDPEEAEALLEEARGGGVYGKSSKWDESKHPRADDGKFGSGRGGGAARSGDYGRHVVVGDETGKPVEDTAFRFNRSGRKAAGDVFWSREKDYAEAFGEEVSGGDGQIEEGTVKLNNPIHIVAKPNQFSDPSFENPIIRKAKEDGYDGVIFDCPENGDRFYVIFGGSTEAAGGRDAGGSRPVHQGD